MYRILSRACLAMLLLVLVMSCEEERPEPLDISSKIGIENLDATDISYRAATLHGTLGDTCDEQVASYGHCWDTLPDPDLGREFRDHGSSKTDREFTTDLTGLEPSRQYYTRSFFIVEDDTVYSETLEFRTGEVGTPEFQNTGLKRTSVNSFHLSAEVVKINDDSLVRVGVCWSTDQEPTIEDSTKSLEQAGEDLHLSVYNLGVSTTYYVRAFASNTRNTGYSGQMEFSTGSGMPVVTTSEVINITATTAESGGNVSDNGGFLVTARGVVWSTSSNPTVESNEGITADGTGTGGYTSTLRGLSANTTYYVRAYVMNDIGTGYGDEVSFIIDRPDITGQTGTLTDYDGNTYNWIGIGMQAWMTGNLKTTRYADGTAIPYVESDTQWTALVLDGRAYCWYENSTANRDTYGGLYTWLAAMNGDDGSYENPGGVQGVCPDGWHVPGDSEWKELEMYLGMSQSDAGAILWRGNDEGGQIKEAGTAHWESPNTGASNSSGFTALPGGRRANGGAFQALGFGACFWAAPAYNGSSPWRRELSYDHPDVYRDGGQYEYGGRSVRCVRDF